MNLIPTRVRAAVQMLARGMPALVSPLTNYSWGFLGGVVKEANTGNWQRNIEVQCGICNPTVFACVTIISQDMAKVPINIVRNVKGNRTIAVRHPAQRLLRKPNKYQTRLDFIQQVYTSLFYRGNVYIFKRRNKATGVVESLHVLHPDTVQVRITAEGEAWYEMKPGNQFVPELNKVYTDKSKLMVPASEIIHHRIFTSDNPLIGITPMSAALVSADMNNQITAQASRFAKNQSRPSGVLQSKEKISPEKAKLLKAQWESIVSNDDLGRTAVLGDGLEWKQLTMSAVDAQMIEQLRWTTEEIARPFRVPLFLLGDLTKVSYRNSEQLMRTYYNGCLAFHMESFEARLWDGLELAPSYSVEFDMDALLRTDMDVRYAAYKSALAGAWQTINEVRAREGLGPIKGGDEPYMQGQYTPLSRLGEGSATTPAGSNPGTDPDGDTLPEDDAPIAGDPDDDEAGGDK